MNLKKLFFTLTFFVLLGTTAFAQVYVSATNGDDTFGTGTQASPYLTIQKAITSASTGSTIYIEAGVYNSTVLTGEGNPITMGAARDFSFVGTSVGANTTVELTAGFKLNHASAIANFTTTGTAVFNFGTTANALVLTAGTMNIATASVVLGNNAKITITDGTLNTLPTKGTNLSVEFDGTTSISSTSAFLPSSLGSGTLTVSKASGNITIDNPTLSVGGIVLSGPVNATFSGSVTVATDGDITNSSTGTLTLGADASSTLTMTSTANQGQIVVNGGGSVVVNSNVDFNAKNAGTASTPGDTGSLTVGNIVALTGASNLTINGNVSINNTNIPSSDGKNAVRHSVTISNAGTGALSIVGSLSTPLSSATFSAPTGGNNYAFVDVILSNTGSGSFSIATAATRGVAGTNGVINTGNGTMTLAQDAGTFSTTYDINNTGTSILEFKGNATIAGSAVNSGKIKINTNMVTLSRSVAAVLNNTGDIYSVTTATTGSGWLKFSGDAPTMTGTGNLPNVEIASKTTFSTAGNIFYGDLKISGTGAVTIGGTSDVKGNLDVNGSSATSLTINDAGNVATVVRGNVNMTLGSVTLGTAGLTIEGTFTMPQGTFTFGSRTLTLKGNFTRTGGTINAAAAGTGTLAFAGAKSQTFTPGTQMNVYNVTVANTGAYLANVVEDDKVTVTASLIVLKDFTITTGRVDLGTSNIRMQQLGANSARFTNGGRGYASTGIGGIIFEGDGANPAGTGDGAVITGTQPFSNIYVRLSTQTNNILTLGAVKISGVLTFDGGGVEVGAADDVGDLFSASTLALDDATVVPTVVINTQNTHGSPYFVTTAPTVTSVYNLTYSGQTSVTIGASDFVTTKVNNLSLTAGTAGKTITFIAGNGTIVGALNVPTGDVFELNNGAARTLTASGDTAAHVVNGTVQGGTFEITGNAATLTGGSGTSNASSVSTLLVDPATTGSFTSTGMKVLTNLTLNKAGLVSTITMNSSSATVGAFVNTAGTTTLSMNSTASSITGNFSVTANAVTLTMNGAAAGTRTIAGNLVVNGGTLTLGSHINVTGTASETGSGSIALGDYNLTLGNAYTHAGNGAITAGTGAVIVAVGAGSTAFTFTSTVDIPNFTLNSPGFGIQFATNGLTVTKKFVHTAGDLDLNSLPLTISGDTYTFTAGTYSNTGATATGVVNLNGAALTITAAANPTFPFVNVNSTGTVTFATSDNTTPTPRNFTVAGGVNGSGFTHTKGNIALGINDLILTNTGAQDADYITAATAGSVTGTATGTNIGEVVFNGANGNHDITLADNYSIQNIKISAATTKGDTKVLTVAGNFTLGANFTFTNSARFVLGDGATITRSAGVFDVVPTFGATVNVNYAPAGALNSGIELPAATNVLNNLTVTSGAPVLTANTTVNGTLFLAGGTISPGTKTLTIVSGGTINRSGGDFAAATTDVPTVTTYNLVYSGAAAITTGKEFVSADTAVTSLTVSMTGNGVLLDVNRTVGAFTMSPTGNNAATVYFSVGTDAATKTLTVTGPTTINNGIVSTQDATGPTSTNASSFVVKGSLSANGGSFGTLGTDDGAGIDGGLNVTFGGASAQNVVLSGNTSIPNITINSTATTAANAVINISGGNLTITNLLTFRNGILNMGANTLYLPRPQGAANGGLGFNRDSVTAGKFGHVVGKVSRPGLTGDGSSGTNGQFVFPVGTLLGEYRPAIIQFGPSYVLTGQVSIEVNHIDASPMGTVNLPLDGGNGVKVGNYPHFYWRVNTYPSSISPSQSFDITLQANNIGYPYNSYQNLRIIRRQDGSATSNGWIMQGSATNYNNYQSVVGSDTTVIISTVSGSGGLIPQGSFFTLGVPTRAPVFTAPTVLADTVNEGDTLTIQFTASAQDVGETLSYSLVGAPSWAAINTTTGLVTLTPNFTVGSATPYNIVVRATDSGESSTDITVAVLVVESNRPPVFSTAPEMDSIKYGSTLTLNYVADDPDGDAVTYSVTSTPAPSVAPTITAAGGVLSFTPAFADAGKDFTLKVIATDAAGSGGTDTAMTVVTVLFAHSMGDVNLDNKITSADAVPILKYVVGSDTLSAEQMYYADVNQDGEIGALDAAWVLYFAVNGTFPSAKVVPTVTAAEFGQLSKVANSEKVPGQTADEYSLPISFKQTTGVVSVYAEFQLSGEIEYKSVSPRVPEGWQYASNFENGVLKIAMAGVNPLKDGNVATINLKLKDKEAAGSIQGFTKLNDNLVNNLNAVKVKVIPEKFALSQNYPNPFNPATKIEYALPENTNISLVVYNMLGQRVKTLVNGVQEAGYYTVNWDGTNDFGSKVSSGIYIYRIIAGKNVSTMKMNLLK